MFYNFFGIFIEIGPHKDCDSALSVVIIRDTCTSHKEKRRTSCHHAHDALDESCGVCCNSFVRHTECNASFSIQARSATTVLLMRASETLLMRKMTSTASDCKGRLAYMDLFNEVRYCASWCEIAQRDDRFGLSLVRVLSMNSTSLHEATMLEFHTSTNLPS